MSDYTARTWTLYLDPPRLLVDACDEGPVDAGDYIGAVGSNWQPGYTREEAGRHVAEYLAAGWTRGSETGPRF